MINLKAVKYVFALHLYGKKTFQTLLNNDFV